MHALDLMSRELGRIANDFRAYAETRDEAQLQQRGRSIAGRITSYLFAEEQVLYRTLMSVAPEVPPSMLLHHRRLQQRIVDAKLKCDANDAAAFPAMLKLQQEMFRYAQCHQRELYPQLRAMLDEAELLLLGGEMLLELSSHRQGAEDWPKADAIIFSWSHTSRSAGRTGLSRRGRSTFEPDTLPVLNEVLYASTAPVGGFRYAA